MEMPARKPVTTGVESRSATQPSRNRLPSARSTPTIRASSGAVVPRLTPPAASVARVLAKIGVIVRIGTDRQQPARAEYNEADRRRDEGEETQLRARSPQPRRRHLLGNGDRRQGQPGDDIAADPLATQHPAGKGGLRDLRGRTAPSASTHHPQPNR